MDNINPRITVIVPAYNSEAYILKCLESIKNQTYPYFCCIVYNDGSADKTSQTVSEFIKTDSRFILLSGEQNIGVPRFVSTAYPQVQTEFFCQVDSDDWIAPNTFEIMVNVLDGCEKSIGVAYGDYQRVKQNGEVDLNDPHFEMRCRSTYSLRKMQTKGFCAFQFRMIRKSAFDKMRELNPKIPTGEDFDLVLKLGEVCQFIHVPKKLYFYRQHDSQTSKNKSAILDATCKRLMEESATVKVTPDICFVFHYTSSEDLFIINRWLRLNTKLSSFMVIVADSPYPPTLLESKEYSNHRVEIMESRDEDTDYSYLTKRMTKCENVIEFIDLLYPSDGVIEDFYAGKSIKINKLDPRASWLLTSSCIQLEILDDLSVPTSEMVGDGEPGESTLYALTCEGIYANDL